jgi:hypothetical protein
LYIHIQKKMARGKFFTRLAGTIGGPILATTRSGVKSVDVGSIMTRIGKSAASTGSVGLGAATAVLVKMDTVVIGTTKRAFKTSVGSVITSAKTQIKNITGALAASSGKNIDEVNGAVAKSIKKDGGGLVVDAAQKGVKEFGPGGAKAAQKEVVGWSAKTIAKGLCSMTAIAAIAAGAWVIYQYDKWNDKVSTTYTVVSIKKLGSGGDDDDGFLRRMYNKVKGTVFDHTIVEVKFKAPPGEDPPEISYSNLLQAADSDVVVFGEARDDAAPQTTGSILDHIEWHVIKVIDDYTFHIDIKEYCDKPTAPFCADIGDTVYSSGTMTIDGNFFNQLRDNTLKKPCGLITGMSGIPCPPGMNEDPGDDPPNEEDVMMYILIFIIVIVLAGLGVFIVKTIAKKKIESAIGGANLNSAELHQAEPYQSLSYIVPKI